MPERAQSPKRVAVLSTYATHGGAAVAAMRHHDALRDAGVESSMVVIEPDPPEHKGVTSVAGTANGGDSEFRRLVDRIAIETNRTGLSDTWFSWPLDGVDLASHPAVRDADALSVHWVSGLLSQEHFESLFTLGKPVIITMHDEWLFTGGCHYTAGCTGFTTACRYCPQLADDPVGVPATVLDRRARFGTHAAGTVVTPSRWLGEQCRQSRVFAGWPHEVIPYACDLEVFSPQDRVASRAGLGCDDDRIWLLFIAGTLTERRKGFEILAEAIEHVASRGLADRLGLVCVGNAPEVADTLSVPVRSPGFVRDEQRLARIYSACDALVLPSIEDNLPNTLVESLACGTPVIGSRVGGIPDFVKRGRSGHLFEPGDPAALSRVLTRVAREPERVHGLRDKCRQLAESSFSMKRHASRWLAVAAGTQVSEARESETGDLLRRSVIRLVEMRTVGSDPDAAPSSTQTGAALFERRRKVLEEQVKAVSERLVASERDSAARLAHIHELQQKITSMHEDGKVHIEQIRALSERLRQTSETHSTQLSTQQQAMTELAESTAQRIAGTTIKLDELAARNARISDEHTALVAEHEQGKAALARVTAEHRDLQARHEHTRSELARVAGDRDELLERHQHTASELARVTGEHEALRDRHQHTVSELARVTGEHEALLDRQQHTASELARVSAEHGQTERELVRLSTERDELVRRVERDFWTRLKGFIVRNRPRLPRRTDRKEAT